MDVPDIFDTISFRLWRRTQVAKGEVCKTSMQRFESARRLQPLKSPKIRVPPEPFPVETRIRSGRTLCAGRANSTLGSCMPYLQEKE